MPYSFGFVAELEAQEITNDSTEFESWFSELLTNDNIYDKWGGGVSDNEVRGPAD